MSTGMPISTYPMEPMGAVTYADPGYSVAGTPPYVYIHQATRSEQELRQIKNIFDSSYAQVVLEDVYAAGMEVYEVYGAMCWPVNFKRFLQVHLRWSTPPRPT